MFAFWRPFRRSHSSPWRARRSSLGLEILEDRTVLSAAGLVPPIAHLTPVPFSLLAGQAAHVSVATFDAADVTGLSASIDWGDGHSAPGTIGAGGVQTYAVTGNTTYANPGAYAVIVTIADPAGDRLTARETILVFPVATWEPAVVMVPSIGIVSYAFATPGLSTAGVQAVFVANTGVNVTPSFVVLLFPPGTQTVLPSDPTVATFQSGTIYVIPVTGPERVGASDQVALFSLREVGLTVAAAVPTVRPTTPTVVIVPPATDASQLARVPLTWSSQTAVLLVTIFLGADHANAPMQVSGTATMPPREPAAREPAPLTVASVPLYRVADRGELAATIIQPPHAPRKFGPRAEPDPEMSTSRPDLLAAEALRPAPASRPAAHAGPALNAVTFAEIAAMVFAGHVVYANFTRAPGTAVDDVTFETERSRRSR